MSHSTTRASSERHGILFTRKERLKPLLRLSFFSGSLYAVLGCRVAVGQPRSPERLFQPHHRKAKAESVSMRQRYVAPVTSAHSLGWVHARTKAASGTTSERPACESLGNAVAQNRRLRKPAARRADSKANHLRLPAPRPPLQEELCVFVCAGGAFSSTHHRDT